MALTLAVYHNSRMCCRHDGEGGVDWPGGEGRAVVQARRWLIGDACARSVGFSGQRLLV